MRQETKAKVLEQTQQQLEDQITAYNQRLREEELKRSNSTIVAFSIRQCCLVPYRQKLSAAQVLQARLRALEQLRTGAARTPRPAAYETASVLASLSAHEEQEGALQLERSRDLEELREETKWKEAHLEERLKQFFEAVAPQYTSKGQIEDVLAKTASADPHLSREARINLLLRDMRMLGGQQLCIGLASSSSERSIRKIILESEHRLEELRRARMSGWAKLALQSGATINIYKLRLNVNLQAQTMEQLRESRKTGGIFPLLLSFYSRL